MGSRWAERAAAALALALAAALLAGTRPVEAQQVTELGVLGIATASDPALAGAGVYAAVRTSLRTRVSAAATVGASAGAAAFRGELVGHFLLNPTRRSGVGAYGAGGLAVVAGPVDQGYLVLALGLEARPGAPSGWFVVGGVGGGARLAVGWRWRRLPPGWLGR